MAQRVAMYAADASVRQVRCAARHPRRLRAPSSTPPRARAHRDQSSAGSCSSRAPHSCWPPLRPPRPGSSVIPARRQPSPAEAGPCPGSAAGPLQASASGLGRPPSKRRRPPSSRFALGDCCSRHGHSIWCAPQTACPPPAHQARLPPLSSCSTPLPTSRSRKICFERCTRGSGCSPTSRPPWWPELPPASPAPSPPPGPSVFFSPASPLFGAKSTCPAPRPFPCPRSVPKPLPSGPLTRRTGRPCMPRRYMRHYAQAILEPLPPVRVTGSDHRPGPFRSAPSRPGPARRSTPCFY